MSMLDPALTSRYLPLGSSDYYALRFLSTENEADLQVLLVWYRELSQIPSQVSDRGVAQTKLTWWRQELQRALAGQSQLPLASALAHQVRKHQLPSETLDEVVTAFLSDLETAPHEEWQQLLQYAEKSGGNIAALLSQMNGCDTPEQLDLARVLGTYVRLVEVVRDLGLGLRHHSNLLPMAILRELDIEDTYFEKAETQPQLSILLSTVALQIQDYYSVHAPSAIDERHPTLLPVMIQTELAQALLQTLQNENFAVLDQRISLSPLRKLWLAWRCSKRKRLKRRYPIEPFSKQRQQLHNTN